MFSIVIPVYRNEPTIDALVERLEALQPQLPGDLEAVFVVDGSPDQSHEVLRKRLARSTLQAQLLEHSRNFGAFVAIRTGLAQARGDYVGVMAADLQEPPELMIGFFDALYRDVADVVVGRRNSRKDPAASARLSALYWRVYRAFVVKDLPVGGVDVFAVKRDVVEQLVRMQESHSSLVGLLYWVGFKRLEMPYDRLERPEGKSAWTFRSKFKYMTDSVFSFTDIPIRLLTIVGAVGTFLTVVAAAVVLGAWMLGRIAEPGYTPLMLAVLFSSFIVLMGLGVVGSYVYRTFENTKGRPMSVVAQHEWFRG
jgi:glycosyltransferase involved in cell wall biosynthesis